MEPSPRAELLTTKPQLAPSPAATAPRAAATPRPALPAEVSPRLPEPLGHEKFRRGPGRRPGAQSGRAAPERSGARCCPPCWHCGAAALRSALLPAPRRPARRSPCGESPRKLRRPALLGRSSAAGSARRLPGGRGHHFRTRSSLGRAVSFVFVLVARPGRAVRSQSRFRFSFVS